MIKTINLNRDITYQSLTIETDIIKQYIEYIKEHIKSTARRTHYTAQTTKPFEEAIASFKENHTFPKNNKVYTNFELVHTTNCYGEKELYYEYESKYDSTYYPEIILYLNTLITSDNEDELNEAYRRFKMFRLELNSVIENKKELIKTTRKWELANAKTTVYELYGLATNHHTSPLFRTQSLSSLSLETLEELRRIYDQIESNFGYEEYSKEQQHERFESLMEEARITLTKKNVTE